MKATRFVRFPTPILTLALGLALTTSLGASPLTFDFKDPKGVNNVSFSLDAPLEAINGSANGISGKVTFDPDNPAATKGRIVVETGSMHVPNPMMKGHMLGKQWMDAEGHPEIVFEVVRLKSVSTEGNGIRAEAVGRIKLKGVEKEITVPVTLTYLANKLADRTNGAMQGDLLVIRAKFSVKRADYGINPGAPADKVADTVELKLAIAGAAARS
ncbi:MAG: YceI family protein [Verrucomicrobiae bacterium]|nr:YceI family protein [Verrucomicrobiae bacterium]